MSNQKDGGPAFPRTGYYPPEAQGMEAWRERSHTETDPTQGMTLRDYFAAAAMQALVATELYRETRDTSMMPKISYAIADAMLEARKK